MAKATTCSILTLMCESVGSKRIDALLVHAVNVECRCRGFTPRCQVNALHSAWEYGRKIKTQRELTGARTSGGV